MRAPQYFQGGGIGELADKIAAERRHKEAMAFQQQAADERMLAQQNENERLLQARAVFEQKAAEAQAEKKAAAEKTEAERVARVQQMIVPQIQARPDRAEFYARTLEAQGAKPNWMVTNGLLTPEEIERFAVESSGAGAAAGVEAPKTEGPQLDPIGKRVILEMSLQPGTPEFQRAYARLAAEEEQRELARRRAGATSVVVGQDGQRGIGLTTSQQTSQQGKILDADRRLSQIAQVEQDITDAGGHDALGGYIEGAAAKGKQVLSATGLAGQATEAQVQARAKAVASLGALKNEVISELSGANVPDSEMTRMLESLPTIDDPPPVRKAKMEAWKRNYEMIKKYGVDALVNGIRSGSVSLPNERRTGQIPPFERSRIIESARRKLGRDPTEQEIERAYQFRAGGPR